MIRILFLAVLMAALLHVAPAHASLDEAINAAMQPVSAAASAVIFAKITLMGHEIPLIILWLLAAGLATTVYFGFINLRFLHLAIQLLMGKYQSKDREGEISNWQALSTSLSGTVGLGNIAGVAVAVSLGGPGATIWMIIVGFIGMSTKFTECALGVKYRQIAPDGEVSGGPMYYIYEEFKAKKLPLLGKALAVLFAVCCMGAAFGGGNMFQSNQTYSMYMTVMGEGSFFDGKAWLFGLILAVMVGIVIIGGIKSIAGVSSKIFPTMAGLYILACLYIILSNAALVPDAIVTIFRGAFDLTAAGAGLLGAMIAGVQRAMFSNEAGAGSAAITHAAVKSDSHIGQGMIAMLNPFIDTVVICTMTALVIAVTGVYQHGTGMQGVTLTAEAFATAGDWTIYWLGLTVFLFAYSTMISWYYLGEKAFTYLFGDQKWHVVAFKIVYCLLIVVGCAVNLSTVVDFTDSLFFAMTIPNIIALYVAMPELKKDLKSYLAELKEKRNA